MPSGSVTSYDLIADFYDDDMGANVGGEDIAFYIRQCAGCEGPILELGCGTGRITLPLILLGQSVVGIDASRPMLEKLCQKASDLLPPEQRVRLRLAEMDMAALAFRQQFSHILCPYSAFTYLVDLEHRKAALEAVGQLLIPDGHFVLDVFVPDPRFEASTGEEVFSDYERTRSDGVRLVRTKTVATDVSPGVNRITREYRFLDASGDVFRRVTTCEVIRYYYPEQLEEVLKEAGFEVLRRLFDFDERRDKRRAKMAALVVRRR